MMDARFADDRGLAYLSMCRTVHALVTVEGGGGAGGGVVLSFRYSPLHLSMCLNCSLLQEGF